MDIRRVTTQGPQAGGIRQKPASEASSAEASASTGGPSSRAGAAQGQAHELVETGRVEAAAQHRAMLEDLRQQIQNGTYRPNWDVVAQRVAETLD